MSVSAVFVFVFVFVIVFVMGSSSICVCLCSLCILCGAAPSACPGSPPREDSVAVTPENMKKKLEREREVKKTRSSWLNCALRGDEAVYWVSLGHYEAEAVGN